jgi:hypothetical protein
MVQLIARARPAVLGALLLAALAALAAALPQPSIGQKRDASTTLFSTTPGGGTPNGPSTNPWISADLRFSQIVAFESEASDLVSGDTNQLKDVFAVRRAGSFADDGSEWKRGTTQLVSRTTGGKPANGPSFDPTTDGSAKNRAKCVAFLSDASNLVAGDTNKKTDAFLAKAPNFTPKRVSLPSDKQSSANTTHVAVSGDCSQVAFVTGGKLFVRTGSSTEQISTKSNPADPAYDVGDTNELVFGAKGGVYLLGDGATSASRIAKGGRNPAYIHRRRQGKQERWVIYEIDQAGFSQIAYRELGGGERIATTWNGELGNGDSHDPSIFNSGFNMAFASDASNLPVKSSGQTGDRNGQRDAYFYTRTQNFDPPVTILESVDSDNDPFSTGAATVSTSYYRNYVVFDSSANDPSAPPQIWMRYLGGI